MLDIARRLELLTPGQMREADRLAIAAGTPGIVLMERAGRAVADEAVRLARSAGRVAVLCGPGANGGDGFIAARLMAARGYRVELALLGRRDALRADAAEAAARYAGPAAALEGFDFSRADLVIDALYGAGLDRDLAGESLRAVRRINAYADAGGAVLAVDLPSGLDGETGAPRGDAVRASASVTFFRLKPGHLLLPGRALCGRLVLADIGIPASALGVIGPSVFANGPRLWRAALPALKPQSHKYARGHAVVVSGGASHTGAARLTARAALRAGAGLVTIASPPDALLVNAAHSTAVMVGRFEGAPGLSRLLADRRRNAVALGPGAGVGVATEALVEAALSGSGASGRAVVLDADALTSFAGRADALARAIATERANVVITPHEGEFARLFAGGLAGAPEASSKLVRARAAAAFLGAVVILKGADTVVAEPGGRAAIGYDLPPTLATAGSGDTLCGLVVGLLAQGVAPFEAASAAVWMHGAAARAFGPGLIAEDLAEALPAVFAQLAAL